MSNIRIKQLLIEAVKQRVYLCRSCVLSAVEPHIQDVKTWRAVRSQILKPFGDRGLEQHLIDDIETLVEGNINEQSRD